MSAAAHDDLFLQAMPAAVINQTALDHNIAFFSEYCAERSLALAPHVKTTMSRQIFQRQRDAGAWAATVATTAQAATVLGWGQDRIIIANQVVDQGSLEWLVKATEGGGEVYSWIDSVDGLMLMEREHRRQQAATPLKVLVEIGHPSGRTGCRSRKEVVELAARAAASERFEVHGLAAFEGTVAGGASAQDEVDYLIGDLISIFLSLQSEGLFARRPALLSVGGSVYFDRVSAARARLSAEDAYVVLRSGCYVTHDCGVYDELSPLGSRGEGGLIPALEVWAAVLSTPEPHLAIAGFGRRDVSFDAGLPRVRRVKRRDGESVEPVDGIEVTALNDQHAFLVDTEQSLAVGDLIGACISHPCTTFDKWRDIGLVDDRYRLLETVTTEF